MSHTESTALLQPTNPPSSSSPERHSTTEIKATKKFYKTRAGIGGKLKDADPLVVWFLGLAFSLPAILMVLIPLFECTVGTCNEDNGEISISSVIEYLPLATVYAVIGAVTLTILCYYQLIICKRGWKIVFAVIGYLFLLVPLMLPLSSGIDTIYHDVFAGLGFTAEVVFVLLVFIDISIVATIPPNGSYIVYICAAGVLIALIIFLAGWVVGAADSEFELVYEIISEYLIGLSALTLVKVLEYFELYPMPRQCDECCWPERSASRDPLDTGHAQGALSVAEEEGAEFFRDTSV